jgi:AAA domain
MSSTTAIENSERCTPQIFVDYGRAAAAENHEVAVTFFPTKAAQSMTVEVMTLPELRDKVLRTAAQSKDRLPWHNFVAFGDRRSDKNCLRTNDNAIEISAVPGDYDEEQLTPEDAAAILHDAGVMAIIYTSASHTDQAPRWRVACPLSRAMPPSEHPRMVARLNGLLGGKLDHASFTAVQAYQFGKVGDNPDHRAAVIPGDFVDERDDLDARAIWRGQKNGHDTANLFDAYSAQHKPPIDVDAALAEMTEGNIHNTQLSVTAALISRGEETEQVVMKVLDATKKVITDPTWNWRKEEETIRGMCDDWLKKHPPKKTTSAPTKKSVELVRASDVIMRPKDWLWKGHLLRGAQELLAGIPGLAKSQVQISWIATVTTGGKWPDGTQCPAPGNVIMLTAEDALDQEVVPRLKAAGANLDRVHILKSIKTDDKKRQFLLAEDLDDLRHAIMTVDDVVLTTVDPLTAYMGGKMDSHKTTEVRSQLGPLKDLAEETNVAFSTITHPAKSPGNRAIDHFIGSQAFIAACRIGHVCIKEMEPDDDGKSIWTKRVLFCNAKKSPRTHGDDLVQDRRKSRGTKFRTRHHHRAARRVGCDAGGGDGRSGRRGCCR